jgi:CheY-like chemotaxis protein
LLVQEDPDDRALYAEQFRALGFTVFEFGDGGEALSLLYANRPRVIVLDVVLPTIDGPELCRKARDLHGDRFSILFLSTLQDIGIMEMCFEAGGNDYLVKNPDPRKVMERVLHWSKPDAMRNQEKDRKLRLATLQTATRIPNSVIDDDSDGLSSETDKQVAEMTDFINKARENAKRSFGRTHEEKLFLIGYVSGIVNYWGTVKAHMQQYRAHYLRAVLRETGILSNQEIRLMLGSLDDLSTDPTYNEAVTRGVAEAVTGMIAGRNALPMGLARFGQRED